MRTSVSLTVALGLLALSLGFSANSAFAGNVEECEVLKDGYTKGLYGLCIAWHNAGNDNARDRILDKYEGKAGPGDPPMPGTEDEVPCPCWDEAVLAEASLNGVPNSCLLTGTESGAEITIYGANVYQFRVDDVACFSIFPTGGTFQFLPSEDAEATCRAGIEALVAEDFGGIECDGTPTL